MLEKSLSIGVTKYRHEFNSKPLSLHLNYLSKERHGVLSQKEVKSRLLSFKTLKYFSTSAVNWCHEYINVKELVKCHEFYF